MSHTPTPWSLGDKIHEYLFGTSWIVPIWANHAAAGDKIAAEALAQNREQARANAEYIVRACNSHEALVSFVRYYASLSVEERTDKEISNRLAEKAKALAAAGVKV